MLSNHAFRFVRTRFFSTNKARIITPNWDALHNFLSDPKTPLFDKAKLLPQLEALAENDPTTAGFVGDLYATGWPPWSKQEGSILYGQASQEALQYYYVASRIFTHEPIDPNSEKALRWHKIAAKKGLVDSMYRVAQLDDNDLRSRKLIAAAASNGSSMAQVDLGLAYLEGEKGLEQNTKRGLKLLETASESGNVYATAELGDMMVHFDNNVSEEEFEKLKARAIQQNNTATARLKYAEEWSANFIKEKIKALGDLTGKPRIQCLLGCLLIEEDKDEEGIDLLQTAIETGYPRAMVDLGFKYMQSEDQSQTLKGVDMLANASQNGFSKATYLIASYLFQNIKIEKELPERVYETFMLCLQQEPPCLEAAPYLYFMTSNGIGCEVDEEKANDYLELSGTVLGNMTEETIEMIEEVYDRQKSQDDDDDN